MRANDSSTHRLNQVGVRSNSAMLVIFALRKTGHATRTSVLPLLTKPSGHRSASSDVSGHPSTDELT